MATQTLAARMDSLEQRISRLEEHPDRLDTLTLQVSQFRGEMRGEFSAVRQEMRELNEASLREMRELNQVTGQRMRVLYEDLVAKMAITGEGTPRKRKR